MSTPSHKGFFELYYVSLQFNARATASITLVHKSCPAGFDIVEGFVPGRYVCRCSLQDANILSCNTSSEDILLRVRASVLYACDKWIAGYPPMSIHETCHYVIPPLSHSLFDSTSILHALSSPFHVLLPQPMQDWLWGTPVTNSDGNRVLFTTSCSRGYCRCQPWYTDNRRECRFTVSQDLRQRDQQCSCNRQGNKNSYNCM